MAVLILFFPPVELPLQQKYSIPRIHCTGQAIWGIVPRNSDKKTLFLPLPIEVGFLRRTIRRSSFVGPFTDFFQSLGC